MKVENEVTTTRRYETFAEYQARAHRDVDPGQWEAAIRRNIDRMYDR